MLTKEIRRSFLKFFESQDHKILPSSPVVPKGDDSLLFINAGMVQFKNIFTGLEARKYKRATTAQKCIRAGGKHNDLDQVGFTARHHTFFEMMGNFSFGDYFKAEAINFAWNFLTKELKLPKERLLVTVYHTDDEAKEIWHKVAPSTLVIPISSSDNFWSMGDTGPCGPCTEIFFDHGENVKGGMPGSDGEDGDRFMEIWNLVFMQFEKLKNGELIPLKIKSIDTGLGLERAAAILQGIKDNYEIDLFKNLLERIKELSATSYENIYSPYKVIADHIRSIAFLIADGVIPSNEGRGYVLRRILRRAMRYGNLLGMKKPFLFDLSDTLIEVMKDDYPELNTASDVIKSTIYSEEEKFLSTLDRGMKILKSEISHLKEKIFSGSTAFKLYDTYGFPLDLTQDILRSENIKVDIDEFNKALEEQKNRAKWISSGEKKDALIWHQLKNQLKPTNFVGYECENVESEIIALIKDDQLIDELSSANLTDSKCYIIVTSTPFFAESGGQCGDKGTIENNFSTAKVLDTHKFCDSLIAHEVVVDSGIFKKGDKVHLKVDHIKRAKTKANHTATHLLQASLRSIFGDHIVQRGSFLNDERLRFDFSHNEAIKNTDLRRIENIVNTWILQKYPVLVKEMSKDEALKNGAMALFGEKYADVVRTVKVGENISFELCGGTHVANTSEIGAIKILSEVSIGSGIRRIEAKVSVNLTHHLHEVENRLNNICNELKCSNNDIEKRISSLLIKNKLLEDEALKLKKEIAINNARVTKKSQTNFISLILKGEKIENLRSLNDIFQKKFENAIVLLINQDVETPQKVTLVIGVDKKISSKYSANTILKKILIIFSGKGGGNATYAQGGGILNLKEEDLISEFENDKIPSES